MNAIPQFRPPGTLDVSTALAPYRGPWNARLAAHLLRRAGFGGSPQEIAQLAGGSMTAAVDALVRVPRDLPAPPALPTPADAGVQLGMGMQGMGRGRLPREDVMQLRKTARGGVVTLQQWWLGQMLSSPAPLREKMTLFWHGHFTTSVIQKNVSLAEMFAQNQLYRANALGNVRALTMAVSKDPAMLRYLDGVQNNKSHPNENYARELMELFTLGIGNYTEQDIRESARAFTGWKVRRSIPLFAPAGTAYFDAADHDDGSKTFLGRTGNFGADDIVKIIFEQPAAPRFLATKLLGFFVYSDPEPELVDSVAALIKKNDFELAPVMSAILRSNVFYSDRAYRALVKSPVEYVVGTYKQFGLSEIGVPTLGALVRMGQTLFYPPNVKGWDGGAAWLNSQTVLTRENFASAVVADPKMMQAATWLTSAGVEPKAVASTLVTHVLQGDASPASIAQLQSYLSGSGTSALGMLSGENYDERIRGAAYLTMAMPAYQLN